jgi:NTE family protein
MRATISLPGIFTPVKVGDMILVDGGVLENIPVDPVRSMGADVVIAVALETNRPRPDGIKSLADVMRQTISLAIAKNEQRSEAKADLVISVDTRRFSANDYRQWKEIVEAGCRAAKAQQSRLAQFEVSQSEWDAYVSDRQSRMRPSEKKGSLLAVTSPDLSFQKNAQSELRRTIGDKVVSEQHLETVLSGMVAATAVPGAAYDWQRDTTGQSGYQVKFAERPTPSGL